MTTNTQYLIIPMRITKESQLNAKDLCKPQPASEGRLLGQPVGQPSGRLLGPPLRRPLGGPLLG